MLTLGRSPHVYTLMNRVPLDMSIDVGRTAGGPWPWSAALRIVTSMCWSARHCATTLIRHARRALPFISASPFTSRVIDTEAAGNAPGASDGRAKTHKSAAVTIRLLRKSHPFRKMGGR